MTLPRCTHALLLCLQSLTPTHKPTNTQPTNRKHGHNEIDEPMFTQPLMYKKIRQHKNAHQQYVERLLGEGSVSKQQVRG